MHLDRRLLGWGVFFLLVGGIPLAVRTNLLPASVVQQWANLWPLLLIGWGIGLLLRNSPIDWIGGAITAITFGVMGGGLLVTGMSGVSFPTGCSSNQPTTDFQARTGDLGTSGQVNVEFNCGVLLIGTVDGTSWNVTGSDRDGRGPKVTSATGQVSIKPDESIGFPGGIRSNWAVSIPRTPSISLGLTLNAGEGNVDLTGATVSTTTATLNAGKLDLNMGAAAHADDVNITVNAGAATITLDATARSINLSLNAGSIHLCFPSGTPLRATWAGTLGSNIFSDAGLTKVDSSTWMSAGLDPAQPHTELHVTANAGSFELSVGGTCRA
jgi:hypothetical protein